MPTPEAENDARNAELEWSARERSPSPPKERLSWACCQAASVTSAARQAEKRIWSPHQKHVHVEPQRIDQGEWFSKCGLACRNLQIRSNEIAT